MAETLTIQHFEVRNQDVIIRFTCQNYGKRIQECVTNLCITTERPETWIRKQSFYGASDTDVAFRLGIFSNPDDGWQKADEIEGWDAFFFENTDYPLHVQCLHEGVVLQSLNIGREKNEHVAAEDEIIFGTINYKNQVGRTDIHIQYLLDGKPKELSFSTEVLSYKMDYRTDMRDVIRDIEEEFAMLSYSFLKETYLTFRQSNEEPTDLIWWQIFRDCFSKITDATRLIISNPKRRLQTNVRYERAERMPYMPPELENEFEEFKDEPAHLYRMEEMYLSKDTIENRFLKYAILSITDRFKRVQQNVLSVLKADNMKIRQEIEAMDETLISLQNDPFFRGIGTFRGFTQDSLVMKQAAGYRDIYEQWIILQCGYDLQEGILQLEVKDISELYEIWCFIKVKNMVEHILRGKATIDKKGSGMEGNFVRTLIQGSKSEVRFFESENPDVQLASLMYNATTDDEENVRDESIGSKNTDIEGTRSITTEQRPDIVLCLSKKNDGVRYTYLFDAKYRLRDTTIPYLNGVDVPPVDAINQMHRYRDAIYYQGKNADDGLKREVIGGYILYPGNISREKFEGSYYHRSVDEVNIGAFPLKPGGHWHSLESDLLIDPTASEDVLYGQIKKWLDDEYSLESLLESAIPQRGLAYTDEKPRGLFLIASVGEIREGVNSRSSVFKDGKADKYTSGHSPSKDIDILKVKYFAPVINHEIHGYYKVTNVNLVNLGNEIPQPFRVQYTLGEYHPISKMTSGVDKLNSTGWTVSAKQFMEGVRLGELKYKKSE